jgi:hypothetical protein
MGGWRQKTVCVLSVVAFLTSACAINSKRSTEVRFSEDLQTDGFSIAYGADGENAQEMTVAITDAESTDRLLEWFRRRPKPADGLGMDMLREFDRTFFGGRSPLLTIETTHFRVNMRLVSVLLETRSSSADAWTQVSWPIRPEDEELRDWAISKVLNNFAMERGLPPIKWEGMRRPMTDGDAVDDRNPEAMTAP